VGCECGERDTAHLYLVGSAYIGCADRRRDCILDAEALPATVLVYLQDFVESMLILAKALCHAILRD
jgi:hypothetical protein